MLQPQVSADISWAEDQALEQPLKALSKRAATK